MYLIMRSSIILFLNIMLILSCSEGNITEEKISFPKIENVPVEKWEKLADKNIFFGHKSVGFNIIDGIQDVMKEHPEVKLNIVETSEISDIKVGVFAHSAVGINNDPQSKIDAFVNIMENETGNEANFVGLKFCWADIMATRDVDEMYSLYDKSISQLKKKYPDMIVFHFTAPLTTNQTGIEAWLKKVRGKEAWGIHENIKRNQYNEMLMEKYKGKEPIFDIAKFESTRDDGTRSAFIKDGKTYYTMVPEYTSDHGHLNQIGRKKVAEQFLIFLSQLL